MWYGGFYLKCLFWLRGRCGNCLNCTSNGSNVECLFMVTHVQSFSGMLTEAANAAWQTIPHLSKTWLFFVTLSWADIGRVTSLMMADESVAYRKWLTQQMLSQGNKCFHSNRASSSFFIQGYVLSLKVCKFDKGWVWMLWWCCWLHWQHHSRSPPSPLTYPCPEVISHEHGGRRGRGGRTVSSTEGTVQNGSYC